MCIYLIRSNFRALDEKIDSHVKISTEFTLKIAVHERKNTQKIFFIKKELVISCYDLLMVFGPVNLSYSTLLNLRKSYLRETKSAQKLVRIR